VLMGMENVTRPCSGAVQEAQSERPAALSACLGSSGSEVALRLVPSRDPFGPGRSWRSPKLSEKDWAWALTPRQARPRHAHHRTCFSAPAKSIRVEIRAGEVTRTARRGLT